MTEITTEEMDVMPGAEQKHTMIQQEMNLDLFVLPEIGWLLITVMNGVGMEEELIIQILLILDEIQLD